MKRPKQKRIKAWACRYTFDDSLSRTEARIYDWENGKIPPQEIIAIFPTRKIALIYKNKWRNSEDLKVIRVQIIIKK